MKKITLILSVIVGMTIKTNAQIPNSGFENWTSFGTYMDPNSWGTPNAASTSSFHAVTRDASHYPASVGSYSIRIESNTAQLANYSGLGLVMSSQQLVPPAPSFPISGHPTSLTGYYKFAPLNGDTMRIQISLYLNGSMVADGNLSTTVAASGWTSFNIPISNYTNADSAHILIAAYNCQGTPPFFVPHGNSVLNIDNLNFDVLILDVANLEPDFGIEVYPNPASDQLMITLPVNTGNETDLTLVNALGEEILAEKITGNSRTCKVDLSQVPVGIYFLRMISEDKTIYFKKIIVAR